MSEARVRRLGPADLAAMRALNRMFAEAFEDEASYQDASPEDSYLAQRLADPNTIVLITSELSQIAGGLVAYVLHKLEQQRSEIYIYDLAVRQAARRRGIATALIAELQAIAAAVGAWAIFVQADYGDDPAVALYEKLGVREDVMHFDIPPKLAR